MVDDEQFAPNFLVKRKLEIPRSDLDEIALIVTEFVPVWEIFRPRDDFYYEDDWELIQ